VKGYFWRVLWLATKADGFDTLAEARTGAGFGGNGGKSLVFPRVLSLEWGDGHAPSIRGG